MKPISLLLAIICTCMVTNCKQKSENEGDITIFDKDNLVAWCIVPFDSEQRGPQERAVMLDDLDLRKLAYDWREEHLPTFEDELQALKEHDIELQAVWFWLSEDSLGYLGESNEYIFSKIAEHHVNTELWFSFDHHFFEGLNDEQKLDKAIRHVGNFRDRAKAIGCTLGLYNHGDWFGEPENQIKIIEALGRDHLGLVYNFHHGHHQIEAFPELLRTMKPYLLAINLNGMKKDGEKILPLGQGDEELQMMQAIVDAGYDGPIGIIGHQDQRDVRKVLEENLQGLDALKSKLKEPS